MYKKLAIALDIAAVATVDWSTSKSSIPTLAFKQTFFTTKMLLHTFSPIFGHMMKNSNFRYEAPKIFIFVGFPINWQKIFKFCSVRLIFYFVRLFPAYFYAMRQQFQHLHCDKLHQMYTTFPCLLNTFIDLIIIRWQKQKF